MNDFWLGLIIGFLGSIFLIPLIIMSGLRRQAGNSQPQAPSSGPELTDQEMAAALSGIHDRHPLWLTFLQLLDAYEKAERINIGAGLERSDRHVFWSAGAADTLLKFKEELIRRRHQARRGIVEPTDRDGQTTDVFHTGKLPRGYIPEENRK